MAQTAILTDQLTKTFGDVSAVNNLDMQVAAGQVFAFLGPNGAGKSTTIKLLLDVLRPTRGTVRVLGVDPRTAGAELQRRYGYLPGDFVVHGRQTGWDLLTYLGNLRGGVAAASVDDLCQRFRLDPSRPIKDLSKGNRQKIGLVQALMHRPELLILDEPTTGLDPFLQHEFADVVREAAAEGRTVFVSSHVMGEVQQFADTVGIIARGCLVAVEDVAALRERATHTATIGFAHPVQAADFAVEHVTEIELSEDGTRLHCRLTGDADGLIKAAAKHHVVTIHVEEPDLEELFFKYYQHQSVGQDEVRGR